MKHREIAELAVGSTVNQSDVKGKVLDSGTAVWIIAEQHNGEWEITEFTHEAPKAPVDNVAKAWVDPLDNVGTYGVYQARAVDLSNRDDPFGELVHL